MDTKKADKYPLNACFRAFCGTLYAVAHILLIREIRASRASLFEQPSDGRFACLMSGVCSVQNERLRGVFVVVFVVVFGVRCRGIKIELTFVTPFAGRN